MLDINQKFEIRNADGSDLNENAIAMVITISQDEDETTGIAEMAGFNAYLLTVMKENPMEGLRQLNNFIEQLRNKTGMTEEDINESFKLGMVGQ